ncbi:MAG: pre-peptidase C-terminal domain-containing protein [Chitinophagaceae bacterium]|nr:pre-peptidase C-terminal domain-containing protein [Chitinophagaceae bacterium]
MKKTLLFMAILCTQFSAFAQQNPWKVADASRVPANLFANRYQPPVYLLFQLNETVMAATAATAPSIDRVQPSQSGLIISIPSDLGVMEQYRVADAPVMDPALAARYPGIHSYAGQGITHPGSMIRFSVGPDGFHGMILSPDRQTIYIDPVQRENQLYVVYARPVRPDIHSGFNCTTEASVSNVINEGTNRSADDGRLRTYRLALACTGEYANYFLNGTETTDAQRKAKVLAAMNTLMTRTNGIYERDFGVHMNLIANNDAIIYLNASTDPWTTEWNTKTQQTIDAVIGNANYDIGHLVHKEASAANNNGNAGCIGCVCKTGSKGSGFTSHVTPEGDPFVVDYTTHEMGHQFGGNHTFTFRNESGTASQFEPGSGSTIMGYAGITGATDVQPHSDDYFHARSVEQISDYIKLATGGAACAVTTITGNTAPVPNGGGNFTIPKSTPFTLTASATDVDGDILTYTWEQMNAGTSATTNPSTTATAGPLFRSRTYSTSPSRTFPILASILDGTNGNQWERLPGVARTLNFRVLVRDNHAGGGNNKDANVVITVNGTAGPFAVTAPNTAVSWAGNSAQTITWSVNSTNLTPVSCANVKISLSTDGGATFSTLLASTPNDGTQAVTIPNTPSNTARIKVEAVGNIFFDISNTNFTITSGSGCGSPAGLATSGITTSAATISWTAVSGAVSYDVDYKLNSSATWTNAATATTATSVNLSGLTDGSLYDWRVRTNCASGSSAYTQAQFTTTSLVTCGAPAGLASSGVTASAATVSWTAVSGAVSYDVDYKLNSSATWTNAATATTATSVNLSGLTASSLYDWRVRTNCASGSSAYTQAQFTTTATQAGCVTAFEANETQATAATISANTATSAAIGSATDIDWYRVVTTATGNFSVTLTNLPGDYDLYVYNSAGTQIGSSTAGGTGNETVTLTNQAAGTYYARVIGFSGAFSTSVCYNLNFGVTTSSGGCANALDNSTNGTTAGAATIPFNTNVTGLISPTGDIDHYKFVITTGGTITITLTTLPGDYDLKLLSSTGSQLAISQAGGTTSETITRTMTPGTYYAQVFGYNGANSATVCYTLKVQLGTAARENIFTDNSNVVKLNLFPNPATQVLNVNVSGNDSRKTITVIDINGRQIQTQALLNGNTSIDISKLARGMYYLRVNGADGAMIKEEKFVKQ